MQQICAVPAQQKFRDFRCTAGISNTSLEKITRSQIRQMGSPVHVASRMLWITQGRTIEMFVEKIESFICSMRESTVLYESWITRSHNMPSRNASRLLWKILLETSPSSSWCSIVFANVFRALMAAALSARRDWICYRNNWRLWCMIPCAIICHISAWAAFRRTESLERLLYHL